MRLIASNMNKVYRAEKGADSAHKQKLIYGIQQVGIGVEDAASAFRWYATLFGADIPVFDDDSVNTFMAPYMGGQPHQKRAIFALNLQGGAGFELWQYLDKKPLYPAFDPAPGDLGIHFIKVKSRDIEASHRRLKANGVHMTTGILPDADGVPCFYVKDPCGNGIQVKFYRDWYGRPRGDNGGIFGCVIGVSDIDRSLKLYRDILGYSVMLYDQTGVFDDLQHLKEGRTRIRRVLLTHPDDRKGGFSKLLGRSEIELIQAMDRKPDRLLEGRHWGDIGIIHVCFDIHNMDALIGECAAAGMPFRILSSDHFDMDSANGRFGYIEDPDGTLIEFVETYRVPLIKKWHIGINLLHRDPQKPLPDWLIKGLSFSRVRFPAT